MVKLKIVFGSLLCVEDHKELRAFKEWLSKTDIIKISISWNVYQYVLVVPPLKPV